MLCFLGLNLRLGITCILLVSEEVSDMQGTMVEVIDYELHVMVCS